jgi:hypothetical protein
MLVPIAKGTAMSAVLLKRARATAAAGAAGRLAVLCLLVGSGLGAAPPKTPAAPPAAEPSPPAAASQVVLPLAEYERLQSKPSVTVIDTLRVSGSFQGHDLTMQLSGRASGLLPRVEVLSGPSGVRIYACEGDAILSRTSSGSFELVPQAAKFSLRCRVATAGSDRLQLESAPSVLWVESQVQDGELINLEEARDNSGRRTFAIVRVTPGASDVVKPTATARYHITLQPEGTLFTYQFEVRNPNRSHQPFVVRLGSGEHVQTVDTSASSELIGSEYHFQLPPGELTIKLTGTLQQPRLSPAVQASVQYLLLESHPLLRPSITTLAQRISAAETGLPVQYRGAYGFLLSPTDTVVWQTAQLEALRTTSFAVNLSEHVFFLSSDGQALGESVLRLDNQGSPALKLATRAEPTFASLQQEPVFLTKNSDGALWLPLGQGPQEVVVQHRQPLVRTLGLGIGTLWLPELDEPASRAHIQLRYEAQWVPLYEEFTPELRLPGLSIGEVLGFLFLVVLTERLLAALGLGRTPRILLGLMLGLGAMTSGWWMALLCTADLAGWGLLGLPWLLGRKWNVWSVVLGLGMGGFLCLVVASVLLTSRASSPPAPEYRSASLVSDELKESNRPAGGPAAKSEEAPGGSAGAAAYQGLPAKFVMPTGSNHSSFSREMLSTRARAVRVVMLSRPMVGATGDVLVALALLLIALQLRLLRQSLREKWEKVLAARSPAPAAAAPST